MSLALRLLDSIRQDPSLSVMSIVLMAGSLWLLRDAIVQWLRSHK